jgi:hypothetical protein
MAKRLRFRVWTGLKWEYWGYLGTGPLTNGLFTPPPEGADIEGRSDRFTGFTDLDGKDVYENDFIKDVDTGWVRRVVFDNFKGWGRETTHGMRMFPLFGDGKDDSEYYKVIGNLHTVGISSKI